MSKSRQLIIFLLLILAYICLVFIFPADPAILKKYHLSYSQAILLNFTVLIPLAAVWLSAFYGYITFRGYAEKIKDSTDGRILHKLSTGLMVLAFSLPILAVVGSTFNYLAMGNPDYLKVAVVIRHVIAVGLPLAAFIIISDATEELASQIKRRANIFKNHRLMSFIIIVAGSIFSWIIVTLVEHNAAPKNIYSFPVWFVVLFTVVPYLYLWYRGIMAAYNLQFYRKHVKGHLYKKSFAYLALGLATVIGLAITIQLLSVLTPQLQRLHFTPLLFIVYTLVALYALGYGLIAVGAKKLTKIEEV
jgi:hypothetical protein